MLSLSSDICILRPVSKTDIERSLIWRNDVDIKKNLLSFRLPITKPMEDQWIDKAMNGDKDRIVFSIDDVKSKAHVGFIELNSIDYFNRNGQYAIVIGDKNARGKGIAKDATRQILDYAFNQLNLHRVYLQVASYNQSAINLYVNLGFMKEGELKDHHFMDGQYHNMICMGMLASTFKGA